MQGAEWRDVAEREVLMDFGTEAGIFLIYTACLLMIYFFGRMLVVPLKYLLRLLGNSLAGGIVLLIINVLGESFGLFVPVNIVTAVVVGLTGVPGLVLLLVYFQFLS